MKKIIGLIGYPLEHTLSPQMQNAALIKLKLDFVYVALPVKPENLKDALSGLRALGIAGANVTIPFKEKVFPYLDKVEEEAKLIGAVNTILNLNGKLIGYNTDAAGFISSLKVSPRGKKILLLGCGGASRAISVGLCKAAVKEIILTDINLQKTEELAEHLKKYFNLKIAVLTPAESLKKAAETADIFINASPVGMSPNVENSPIPEDVVFSKKTLVYDIIYNPPETKLLKTAKKHGAKTMNGLEMLARQGSLSFKIFTGVDAPLKLMLKVLQRSC